MNLSDLKTNIQSTGALNSLVATGNHEGIAQYYNTVTTTGFKVRGSAILTERGIIDVLSAAHGPSAADSFLTAIETAAQANSLLARIVRILRDYAGGGLDFADPIVHAQLDALVGGGVINSAHATTLKNYGLKSYTRAESLFGVNTTVTHNDVAKALVL